MGPMQKGFTEDGSLRSLPGAAAGQGVVRYRDDYRDRDYRRRSRSRDRYDRYHGRERGYHYRSRSRSYSPDYGRSRDLGRYDVGRWSWSRSIESQSPRRSLSPHKTPTRGRSPVSRSPSPHLDSRNPSTRSPYQE